jgi:hypothetical protein
MASLIVFLRENCSRPKICLRAAGGAAIKLVQYLSGVPDAEVMLISDQGLRIQKAWLPDATSHPYMQGSANQAETLARCAERLI